MIEEQTTQPTKSTNELTTINVVRKKEKVLYSSALPIDGKSFEMLFSPSYWKAQSKITTFPRDFKKATLNPKDIAIFISTFVLLLGLLILFTCYNLILRHYA
jgi:hypothetical protein